ncbi:MAG: HDOD domain-containing protein [Bacteroidetes bacterium]|jgi:HD-like signal output (HDOD) protein|nr:HDOD domain-containing protein [Bacteroidota bacterium]
MDPHNPEEHDGILSQLELRCPPLPQTLTDALALIHRPERLEVGPVTDMVERDPAVVARLLQTVNSAYYGLEHPVSGTQRAVVLLGPVAVTGLVVGMNMLKLRSIMEGPAARCFLRLVRHNIAVAYLARHLYEDLPARPAVPANDEFAGDAFTSGLLHDFGKVILVYNCPEEAVALYEDGSIEQEVHEPDHQQMEQLLFGYDHTEAGEYAARKLNFPTPVVDTIAQHHDRETLATEGPAGRLLRAVTGANLAVKAMGHAFSKPIDWDECMDHPVWPLMLERDFPEIDDRRHLRDVIRIEQDSLDAYVEHLTHADGALPPPLDHPDRPRLLDPPQESPPSDPSANGTPPSSNGVE